MQLISVIMYSLWNTVSQLQHFLKIILSHTTAKRQTSIGFQKTEIIFTSIYFLYKPSLIALHRGEVILRLSLYCLREIRLGISFLYSCNLANSKDSLSIPIASEIIFNAITSRSENRGTTSFLGILPDSFTKLPATCLHMFRYFANIAYRLCIVWL